MAPDFPIEAHPDDRRPLETWGPVLLVWVILVAPLIVTCAWLRWNDHWPPVFDLAMTEARVRDVGTIHTPLLGLPGRLGQPEIGCHPGPLSFYLLAPVYRLLGSSYWALRVSTATFHALAIATVLVVARRCAGVAAVVIAGAGLAFLELGFGLLVLTEPWNPYLPVLWFPAFLLATWAVLLGDLRMLPIALAIGSLCAQTHVPYAAVCGAIGLFAFIRVVVARDGTRRKPDEWGPLKSSLGASAAVAVLWAPPILEELRHHPGNLTVLFRFFAHPPILSLGLASAAPLALVHLDAWHFVVHSFATPNVLSSIKEVSSPTSARGGVFLVLWGVAALMSVELGHRALLALHGMLAVTLVVVWFSASRIMGPPWPYLLFGGWSVGVLLFLATASTAGIMVWNGVPDRWRTRAPQARALGVAVILSCAVRLATEVPGAGSSAPNPSRELATLAPRVVDAVRRGVGAATGAQGRYLATWEDALYGGGQGLGLVNELERQGLRVGISKEYGRQMGEHRMLESGEETARIHLATGGWIREAKRLPGAVQVAYSDPRSADALQEYSRLRAGVRAELGRLGREDAIERFDRNLASARVPGANPFLGLALQRMAEIGVPAAVFILPAR